MTRRIPDPHGAPRPWCTSPEEEALVDASRAIFAAMAARLHDVEEARYVDPMGGFEPAR